MATAPMIGAASMPGRRTPAARTAPAMAPTLIPVSRPDIGPSAWTRVWRTSGLPGKVTPTSLAISSSNCCGARWPGGPGEYVDVGRQVEGGGFGGSGDRADQQALEMEAPCAPYRMFSAVVMFRF